jgi:cyclophilin family peptidyl-prolyl cis-trans isomerase
VRLFSDRAPGTVNNFVSLARWKYFDGTQCHRVIEDFVVQCGDPTANGTGGPGYSFADELPQAGEYKIGSLAMANSGPNTNGSQFFIITGDNGASLPPSYSLFGEVVEGLDTAVQAMGALFNPDPAANGVPPAAEIVLKSVTINES